MGHTAYIVHNANYFRGIKITITIVAPVRHYGSTIGGPQQHFATGVGYR